MNNYRPHPCSRRQETGLTSLQAAFLRARSKHEKLYTVQLMLELQDGLTATGYLTLMAWQRAQSSSSDSSPHLGPASEEGGLPCAPAMLSRCSSLSRWVLSLSSFTERMLCNTRAAAIFAMVAPPFCIAVARSSTNSRLLGAIAAKTANAALRTGQSSLNA
eukprot:CAMPEP_0183437038 /NCGR_PEP_ID=MMETSP0370-20130417/71318_1 /TAXON_ID=268820 /ORGANISM="Peridinium aciculiferum, Strain PAER-2" /LENGTH=160 /DNA_ID=CAMNT_0025624693 /DNA_START=237 /DNA_END=719 /DNA_ORIENTATION=+